METCDWLLPAVAMGLGWGIRGQFGHESGAMVPGALVGAALAWLAGLRDPRLTAQFAAMGALGCAVGGVMTYGQTVGLVVDGPRRRTMAWGLLGLAVKGGVWMGLTGAMLGLVASPRPCGALLGAGWMVLATVAAAIGIAKVNRPHDPPRALPAIYFSKRDDPKPRPETWAGLWAGFALLLLQHGLRGDRAALALALGGLAGGALGFPLGCLGQYVVRHHCRELWRAWIDGWKIMECGFGALGGAGLGIGAALGGLHAPPPDPTVPLAVELPMMLAWCAWLVAAEWPKPAANRLWERPFLVLIVPVAAVLGGRLAPWLIAGPVLIWLSGDNLVLQALREGLATPATAWRRLALATALTVPVALWLGSPRAWLLWLAVSQTALTWLWMLARADCRAARGWRARARVLRAGLVTELAFAAACLALVVLTR